VVTWFYINSINLWRTYQQLVILFTKILVTAYWLQGSVTEFVDKTTPECFRSYFKAVKKLKLLDGESIDRESNYLYWYIIIRFPLLKIKYIGM